LKDKRAVPDYVKILLNNHKKITSGRKNFEQHHLRIIETIKLIKRYFNLKK
tara:strand:+ start:5349 stop:5501 length:153 start_codon:yes stop_codon:yes gene_type:complete